MRNIKKLLALMLVMVMALCMVPMVASASDNGFTDADDIEFSEAAGLLDEIGVIQGYTDGSFRPAQSVTRAEAVAFIVRMLLTFEVAQRLPDNRSSFTDVLSNPSAAWAAGEIEYAFGEGIVLGRGEGLFDPQGEVTGIEMAAFLLRALGIGKYDNPATWAISAVADGTKEGILTIGPEVDLSGPANREQVALYTFNSLFVGGVDAVMKTIYVIRADGGGTVEGLHGTSYDSFLEALTVGQTEGIFVPASKAVQASGEFTINTDEEELVAAKGGLIDSVFNIRPTQGRDDFWRPTIEYKTIGSNSKTIFTAAVEPVASYVTSVTQATMFGAFGASGNTLSNVQHYKDGASQGVISLSRTNTSASADVATDSGRGVITELYTINNVNRIVTINTWIGQITAIRPAAGSTPRRVNIVDRNGKEVADVETDDFANNDWVVFTVAATEDGDVVQSIAAIEPAVAGVTVTSTTGTVGSTTGNTGSFIAGGVSYNFNKNNGTGTGAIANIGTTTFDLFLDDYDNVLYARAASTGPASYLYVPHTYTETRVGIETWEFRVVFDDGKVDVLRGAVRIGATRVQPVANTIYTYTVRDGVYTLTVADNFVQGTSALTLTRGTPAFNAGSYFGTNNTTYVLGDTAAGFSVFTGFANAGMSGVLADRWAIVKTSGTADSVAIVFVSDDATKITGTTGRNVVVLADGRVRKNDSNISNAEFFEYIAFIDGERVTVRFDTDALLTNKVYKAGSLNLDENNFVRTAGLTGVDWEPASSTGGTAFDNGVYLVTGAFSNGVIGLSTTAGGSDPTNTGALADAQVTTFTIASNGTVTVVENTTVASIVTGDLVLVDRNSAGVITAFYVYKSGVINSADIVGRVAATAVLDFKGGVAAPTSNLPVIGNASNVYTAGTAVWAGLNSDTTGDFVTGSTQTSLKITLTAASGRTFTGTNITTNWLATGLLGTFADYATVSVENKGFEYIITIKMNEVPAP